MPINTSKLQSILKESRRAKGIYIEKRSEENQYFISDGGFITKLDDFRIVHNPQLFPKIPDKTGKTYRFNGGNEPENCKDAMLSMFLNKSTFDNSFEKLIKLPLLNIHGDKQLMIFLNPKTNALTFINESYFINVPDDEYNIEYFQQNQKSPLYVKHNDQNILVVCPMDVSDFEYLITFKNRNENTSTANATATKRTA